MRSKYLGPKATWLRFALREAVTDDVDGGEIGGGGGPSFDGGGEDGGGGVEDSSAGDWSWDAERLAQD